MQNEDQYLERTPDFVAKVRAMREAAHKEMDRFTRSDDYDVRRVVGHGPTPAPISPDTVPSSTATERTRKTTVKSTPGQAALEFTRAFTESDAERESA